MRPSNEEGKEMAPNSDSPDESGSEFGSDQMGKSSVTCGVGGVVLKNLDQWERLYTELDTVSRTNNFERTDKLCELLSDESKWDKRILYRPWSRLPGDKIRSWHGDRCVYHNAYRVIDGIREARVCMLMDYCQWDKAVKVCDDFIYDDKCMFLTGKAQISLNKLHALLESRRMREAFHFFQQMLDGSPRMKEILRTIEKSQTYQWHYSLARIHFLHNELEKAQHHAEMACLELDKLKNESFDEPLQSRMWVHMIRAWTSGLICIVARDYAQVCKVLELWERTVCDLDRKSVSSTIGLKEPSVFCRLKFVEFLMIAVRSFPELEVHSYADATRPENYSVISTGKALLQKLRSITNELLNKTSLSVEVTNARYHPTLDQAMIQLGYLSTKLDGLLNNWALVIDAGPIGNEGRFANHTDDPNAVLALGEASGIRVRVLQAVKPIARGEEITVHYGGNYWDVVAENRKTTIVQKYESGDNSSMAPSARKKAEDPSNFYAFRHRYEFQFFDGVVCDLNGSGLPALVLLQSLGEIGTSADASNMELSSQRKGLKVVDCPPTHAAYPGKMLVADRDFAIGERITIYAGIMSRMPEAQLKLNESDYMSTVCSMCAGAYGFELEDSEAQGGMVFKRFQTDLPSLTPLPSSGLMIPNTNPRSDLSGIEDIRGIGFDCTRRLVDALQDNSKRDTVSRLLRRLRSLPDKNWKQFAATEIKKVLPSSQPPKSHVAKLSVVCDEERPPKKTRTEPPPAPGLNGKYWDGLETGSTSPNTSSEVDVVDLTFEPNVSVVHTSTLQSFRLSPLSTLDSSRPNN